MIKTSILVLLALCCAVPCFAAPFVTLPDDNVYYYWFRAPGGPTNIPPKSTGHSGKIDLAKHLAPGGTLYIQDPHTGGIASIPLSSSTKGAVVTIDEFHGTPTSAGSSESGGASAPTHSAPSSENGGQSMISRIVSWIFGLIVFAGAIWLIRKLVMERGQPIIDIARKVGVDVPNIDDLPKNTIQEEGKYEAPPVPKVQKVPEEALRPAGKSGDAGFLVADDGTSYGIGSKTTSIGRGDENDIVLPDSSVSRKHARIEMDHGQAELYDENSANGIFVNGQKVDRQPLKTGDRVMIGKFALRYEK
jgi:hypothetical protein